MNITECYYCHTDLRKFNETYLVQRATKSMKRPFRWATVGHACPRCVERDKKPCRIDPWS